MRARDETRFDRFQTAGCDCEIRQGDELGLGPQLLKIDVEGAEQLERFSYRMTDGFICALQVVHSCKAAD